MTRPKFADLIAAVLTLLPFVAWFIFKDSLPDKLPIHWNMHGEVDGWTTKDELPLFLAGIAALGIIVYGTLRFIKRIDPKRSAQMNENVAVKIALGVVTFISATNVLIIVPKSESFNTTTVVLVMVSLLLTFLGNLMYNIKPNYFIGIRVPWTLENADNWKHTHRLAGIVWFTGGIACAALALLLEPGRMLPIFLGVTLVLVLIPVAYSFILFTRTKQTK